MMAELFLLVLLLLVQPLNSFPMRNLGNCLQTTGLKKYYRQSHENFKIKRNLDFCKLKNKYLEVDGLQQQEKFKASSTIARLLQSAEKLRSEIEVMEGSNDNEVKMSHHFSEFVTTRATDMRAKQIGLF